MMYALWAIVFVCISFQEGWMYVRRGVFSLSDKLLIKSWVSLNG